MKAIALTLVLFLTGCASIKDDARLAVLADGATTLAGVSTGVAKEANPLLGKAAPGAIAASVALRLGAIELVDRAPEPARTNTLSLIDAITWGVVVNNLAVLAGSPAHALIGIAFGWWTWHRTEQQRVSTTVAHSH